jgi:hypothetical protein
MNRWLRAMNWAKMRGGESSLSATKCIERTWRKHEFALPLHFR